LKACSLEFEGLASNAWHEENQFKFQSKMHKDMEIQQTFGFELVYFTIYNLESTIAQQIINVHIAHNSTSPSQSSNFQNSRFQAHCPCFVAPKSIAQWQYNSSFMIYLLNDLQNLDV
jgi:hypothetical protein